MYKTNNTGKDIGHETIDYTAAKASLNADNPLIESVTISTPSISDQRYNFNDTHVFATNWLFKTAKDNRLFLEAVLWIVRTGSPWRDLPQEFGNWNSVYRRYRRWVQLDVFKNIFTHLNTNADYEYTMIDGTIVKTHRHGQGAKGGRSNRQSADPKAG